MKTQREITATANDRLRIFTIRIFHNGKLTAKYRTLKQTAEEFQSNKHNTPNDWNNFLRNSDEYYLIK